MSETPESNPGALVVSSPKALVIANRQLHIAGQALARIGHERYIEFFATHPEASRAFVRAVSRYYPLSESMIERYSPLWDWKSSLIWNKALPWTEALIDRYADKWQWDRLSRNESLPWSDHLVERYMDLWDWFWVSRNRALPWNELLLDIYFDFWDWKGLSENESIPWSDALIEGFSGCWDWAELSGNRALPWSEALIERYAESWDWDRLSMNRGLPWSETLIETFASRWTARGLSINEALPLTPRLIECFKDRWQWVLLSRSKALPWSEILIEQYEDLWDWDELTQNEAIPWSDALIGRYLEHWYWSALSLNKALPWSAELIDRYSERWDWEYLSANESLPWSEALIERYAERWQWAGSDPESPALSGNPGLPWSPNFIKRFEDRWNWDWLSDNAELPWCEALLEQYADVWDWTVIEYNALPQILPRWSDGSVRAVMDRMLRVAPARPADINMRILTTGMYLARFHIGAGVRRFIDVAECISEDLGRNLAELRPYLRRWYNSARTALANAGLDVSDMDDPAAVKREMERLFPEATQGKASTRVLAPVQDKECGSDSVDHAKAEQHHENPAQPAGLDPEMMEAEIYLATFHIEAGARAFAAYSKAMTDDLGEAVRPYLRAWYDRARDMLDEAGQDVSDMDDPTTVFSELAQFCSELAQGEATAAASVPAQPERITRRDVLHPFMDTLEDLLRQEDDPPATMRWLETCLYDEGLVGEMRTDNPMAFAIDLMENLLEKDPDSYIVPLQDPRAFENAEELVLAMLKGTWDH